MTPVTRQILYPLDTKLMTPILYRGDTKLTPPVARQILYPLDTKLMTPLQ